MNRSLIRLGAVLMALTLVAAACSDDDETVDSTDDPTTTIEGGSPDEASVSFETPADGSTVPRRFDVSMVASAFTIEPAAEGVNDGAGHFHIMVDTPCLEAGETIPADESHLHFGGAQTTTQLELEPGEHTLCLQVADGEHTALELTNEISVTVDGDLPFVTLTLPEGDALSSPVSVEMEATNFTVEAAAEGVNEGAGHFHVMVDTDCVADGEVIPADESHLHFGDGSTTADLELEPGEHTLCLQLADGEHTALPYTHVVKVMVA